MPISLFSQNLRGIRTKHLEFQGNFLNINTDFFCLTETWLNSDFVSSEFVSNNFISHRKDRNYNSTKTTRGGGCWIIHRPDIDSVRRHDFELNLDFIEDLWIQVKLENSKHCLFICTVYITPMQGNTHLYSAFADKVKDNIARFLDPNDRILIIGDFNVPKIKWLFNDEGSSDPFPIESCEKSNEILNLMHFGDLTQYNAVSNKDDNILELVLSSDPSRAISVEKSKEFLVLPDDYHPPFEITLQAKLKFLPNINHRKFKFRKANYELICNDLEETNWDFIETLPLKLSMKEFYDRINNIIHKHTPLYKKKSTYPFWYDNDLIKSLKKRKMQDKNGKGAKMGLTMSLFPNLEKSAKLKL